MLTIIRPERGGPLRREPWVSISGKFNRITLFRGAYELMMQQHGGAFGFVKFAIDKDQLGTFWMIPRDKEDLECVRIVLNRQNKTRTLGATHLLRSLGWTGEETVRCPVIWDSENGAARVLLGGEGD